MGALFPKFEHGQRKIYVEIFLLYYDYDVILKKFGINVVLSTYVMQVCEYRFAGFTL